MGITSQLVVDVSMVLLLISIYKLTIQPFVRRWGAPSLPLLPTHCSIQPKLNCQISWLLMSILWKKLCTTLDGENPINSGINQLSSGAGFRNYPRNPRYILTHIDPISPSQDPSEGRGDLGLLLRTLALQLHPHAGRMVGLAGHSGHLRRGYPAPWPFGGGDLVF